MAVCDDCGAIIDPEYLQVHYDWHLELEKHTVHIEEMLRKLRHDLLIACQQRHLRGVNGD